ncbi:MAG: hypothetical protein J2P41_08860 [Blastocatellia bacterium]|nr:hypothetical protein [Blastocatellia bacterium]
MTSITEKLSVWLSPHATDYAALASIITGLSERYGTFNFEPHLTLYSGVCNEREVLQGAINENLIGVEPIALRIAGVHASQEFFKSLFIEFEECSRLSELNRKIKSALKQDSGYILKPHLSLLYKDLEIDRKWEIARTITMEKTEMIFDEIKFVSPGNKASDWRDVELWEVWFNRKLS